MVQVIKPQVITERITTNTVQGEVTINLNLTIMINHDGSLKIATTAKPENKDIPDYVIPEFSSNELLNDFGSDR